MNDYVGGLFAGKIININFVSPKNLCVFFLGVISTFVVHPVDTLKVTMQSHSTHSISKAVKLIIQLNSVRQYAK